MFGLNYANKISRRRWFWAVWGSFALTMALSMVLVNWIASSVDTIAVEREQRSETLALISNQMEIDLTAMQSSIGLTQVETIKWHGFSLLRQDFERFKTIVGRMKSPEGPNDNVQSHVKAFDNLAAAQRGFVAAYRDVIHRPDAELERFLPRMESDLDQMIANRNDLLRLATREMLLKARGNSTPQIQGAFIREFDIWIDVLILVLVAAIIGSAAVAFWVQRCDDNARRSIGNLQAIIDSSRDAVIIMDSDIKIRQIGGSAKAMFGIKADETLGRNAVDLFASELPHTEMTRRTRELFAEKPEWMNEGRRLELNGKRLDGTTFPIEAGFGFVQDQHGEQLIIASIVDCTDQAERELNLMQARNEALQAERAKSRFLSSMSHEMRTPLNGMLASLDLMRETTQLNARQAELAAIIERCGDDALEQVENVLELTRLDALANTAVNVAPFSPASVLREIVEASTSKAHLNDNELRFETTAPYNLYVEGSAILFRQIMHNFISNAIKFTSNGEVLVTLEVTNSSLDSTMGFRAAVRDTGIGIHADDVERIFSSFETIRDSYSHFRTGSGLGLSIAKHSADLMGAKIDVSSEPGNGSTFTLDVTWPSSGYQDTETNFEIEFGSRDQSVGTNGMSILVVEDNEINRRMLVDMLQSRGHRVTEASDGIDGVTLGRETEFDLILMDISMPKLDGVGATRMLRQFGKSKRAPIVAVTAHSQPEHLKEFMDAGMDRVLTKPLRLNTLDQLFEDMGRSKKKLPPKPPVPVVAAKEEKNMSQELIDMEVFDALIDMLGGDSVVGYLDQFKTDADKTLPVFVASIRSGDFATARSEAHRCAGGAAVIGAGQVHKILQKMTHLADDEQADECLALAEGVPQLVTDSMAFMKAYAASSNS